MSPSGTQARVGQALIEFAVNSSYPDEEAISAAHVESPAFPVALDLLSNARSSLEHEIRTKSHDAGPDVDTWIEHAKALQEEIESSKRLANDIIRKAEADEHREELVEEQQKYVVFLENEVAFNNHLSESLRLIKEIYEYLERAEELLDGGQVIGCLHTLELARDMTSKINKTSGATAVGMRRLLETRASDLSAKAVDLLRNEISTASVATHAMAALEILQQEVKQFWYTLDDVIVKPRTDLSRPALRYIHIENNTVRLGEETADSSLKSLFTAMEELIRYLRDFLPEEFIQPLSAVMMPDLSARLKEFWLDTAVPSSVDEVSEYQKSVIQVHEFANTLESLSWPGWEAFQDWTQEAPKLWINKRRETALDWIRVQLELGMGIPQRAEHLERQMVGLDEGKRIASSANVVSQDWDAAWNSEDEESLPLESNRASLEETREASEVSVTVPVVSDENDDDTADAWGWGDEDTRAETVQEVTRQTSEVHPSHADNAHETRQITLSETYCASSIPRAVFSTVAALFNDGAKLTSSEFEDSLIASAAPGLFHLPKLVLTMYRAVSPFHYARHECGNMFTYNDSIWLCDKLREFQTEWDKRTNLSPRAYRKVILEPEIKILGSFGKRAYTNELNAQRTVITDLLGGAQNFFTEDGTLNDELDKDIDNVVIHIRRVAALWEPILQYSAWVSSMGSLVNSVCSKIISDVFDLESIGSNQAQQISSLIDRIMALDDLFLRKPGSNIRNHGTNGDDANQRSPAVDQCVDRWMALKSLNLLLESNLEDIRFYWFEGSLSDHLTAEEVVELIGLSFENNAGARHLKREISSNPSPRRGV